MFRCAPGILVLAFWASNCLRCRAGPGQGEHREVPAGRLGGTGREGRQAEPDRRRTSHQVRLRHLRHRQLLAGRCNGQDGARPDDDRRRPGASPDHGSRRRAARLRRRLQDRDRQEPPGRQVPGGVHAVDEGSRRPAAQEGRPDRARRHGRDRRSHHDRRQGRCRRSRTRPSPRRCGRFIWGPSRSTRRSRRD